MYLHNQYSCLYSSVLMEVELQQRSHPE